MDRVIAQCYSSILEDSRKIHLWGVRARRSKDTRREKELALAPLFIYVYLSLGLSCVNWASQECCLFSLRSSLRSSDLLLFHFAGFSLPCLYPPPLWTPLPCSTYLTLLKSSGQSGGSLGWNVKFRIVRFATCSVFILGIGWWWTVEDLPWRVEVGVGGDGESPLDFSVRACLLPRPWGDAGHEPCFLNRGTIFPPQLRVPEQACT